MTVKKINRRQALVSMATISAAALIRPSSIWCSPVKDKVRFAVIGDWGTGDSDQVGIARQMLNSHRRSPFDFVISSGDNIYPDGRARHFAKNFEQPFADLLKDKVNFYTVLGNHDAESGRQDQRDYPLFNMGGATYYKMTSGEGLVEFFMLDTTDFDRAQSAWLENSLRTSTARWKIAVFHHPIYCSAKRHGSDIGLRKQLEPLFTRYGVNVGLSGHDHVYERTKPQQGIPYFVSGAGGKVRRGDVDRRSSLTAAGYDDDNHFMIIELDGAEARFQAISGTGVTVDSGSFAQETSK
jgi:3',5'-cyclic AMP phosphodiesterase CpdA